MYSLGCLQKVHLPGCHVLFSSAISFSVLFFKLFVASEDSTSSSFDMCALSMAEERGHFPMYAGPSTTNIPKLWGTSKTSRYKTHWFYDLSVVFALDFKTQVSYPHSPKKPISPFSLSSIITILICIKV